MIEMRLEQKPFFEVAGRSVYITGQDNEQFAAFWRQAHESGLVKRLKLMASPSGVTRGALLGVSCVDRDPDNRAFDFIISAEVTQGANTDGLQTRVIPASLWAIFSNKGELPASLVEAEMKAFMEWLPASRYKHANAPELEVYPVDDEDTVEFWLPITERE